MHLDKGDPSLRVDAELRLGVQTSQVFDFEAFISA